MDAEHAGELLARARARIESALANLDPPDPYDVIDPEEAGDAGGELLDNALTVAQAESLRAELDAIERAELRLAQGTYGVSVESGQPIPDARLEAIPWAERTVEEQARFGTSDA